MSLYMHTPHGREARSRPGSSFFGTQENHRFLCPDDGQDGARSGVGGVTIEHALRIVERGMEKGSKVSEKEYEQAMKGCGMLHRWTFATRASETRRPEYARSSEGSSASIRDRVDLPQCPDDDPRPNKGRSQGGYPFHR